MDRHAYHTLQILDHVFHTPVITNRRIAAKLNVSAKLAHGLLGKLVQRGLLHIRKRNSRRWDYFLTPTGIAEKARLTYEFMDFTMQFYREARRRSSEVLAQARKAGVKRVAFLGANELAEIAYLGIREQQLELVDIFDDERANEEFLGVNVRPISEMPASAAERILITAFDPTLPMAENYVPSGVPAGVNGKPAPGADSRLVWIFGAQPPSEPASREAEKVESAASQ